MEEGVKIAAPIRRTSAAISYAEERWGSVRTAFAKLLQKNRLAPATAVNAVKHYHVLHAKIRFALNAGCERRRLRVSGIRASVGSHDSHISVMRVHVVSTPTVRWSD